MLFNLILIGTVCFTTVVMNSYAADTTVQQNCDVKERTLVKVHEKLHCIDSLIEKYNVFFKLKDSDYRYNNKDLRLSLEDFENLKNDYSRIRGELDFLKYTIDLFTKYDYNKIKKLIIDLKKNEKYKKNRDGCTAKEMQAKFKGVWPLKEWSIDSLNTAYKSKYGKSLKEEFDSLYSNACLLDEYFSNVYYFVDETTADGARIIEEWDLTFNRRPRVISEGGTWKGMEIAPASEPYPDGTDKIDKIGNIVNLSRYLKGKIDEIFTQRN